MARGGEQELKKRSPEAESQVVALILTTMVWLVVATFCILLPPQSLKKETVSVYQSIALNVVAQEGGAPLPEPLAEIASSQSSSPAPSEVPSISAPEASPLPEKSLEPAVVTKPTEKTPNPTIASKPVAQASSQKSVQDAVASVGASAVSPALSPDPATPPVKAPDVESLDEAAWEALFTEKGGRSYNNTPSSSISSSSDASSLLSGVAASASSGNESAGVIASSLQSNATSSQILSQDTAVALGQIASAAEGGQGSGFAKASQSDSAGTGAVATPTTPGTDISLVGGGSRRLLEPQEPIIVISVQNQSLIKGSTEVTITFDITPEGLVLPGSIKISPEALVHRLVQAEIKNQLEKWRFQAAKGSGQVRFKYNIIKK
ncbi:MAG: hypothetical protein J6V57_01865 [Spirochaetaceae bacterium]|nr:hypothetical protein [Spirochaetaceae bacterium]